MSDLKTIVPSLPLNKIIFTEGTAVGQVAFHTAQSVSFYLRRYVLNEEYKGDRDAEYTTKHTSEEILESIDKALEACDIVVKKDINLTDLLRKTKTVYSRKFEITTVFEAIQHITAHTAEHYGQLALTKES